MLTLQQPKNTVGETPSAVRPMTVHVLGRQGPSLGRRPRVDRLGSRVPLNLALGFRDPTGDAHYPTVTRAVPNMLSPLDWLVQLCGLCKSGTYVTVGHLAALTGERQLAVPAGQTSWRASYG
jgi:hypothetical protein